MKALCTLFVAGASVLTLGPPLRADGRVQVGDAVAPIVGHRRSLRSAAEQVSEQRPGKKLKKFYEQLAEFGRLRARAGTKSLPGAFACYVFAGSKRTERWVPVVRDLTEASL